MGAEDFLKGLMENYDEENSSFVSVVDVDEYGNVVYSNSVVVEAQPRLIGPEHIPTRAQLIEHAINLIQPETEPLEESKT
jgi:hypothetical protein